MSERSDKLRDKLKQEEADRQIRVGVVLGAVINILAAGLGMSFEAGPYAPVAMLPVQFIAIIVATFIMVVTGSPKNMVKGVWLASFFAFFLSFLTCGMLIG